MRSFYEGPDGTTPLQDAAAQALIALIAEEGIASAERVLASLTWGERRQMWAAENGLEQYHGYMSFEDFVEGRSSQDREGRRHYGFDHTSLWLWGGAPAAYVFQPYRLCDASVRELVDLCDEFGLVVDIDVMRAWHFPGWTPAVALWRREVYSEVQRALLSASSER